MKRREFLKIGAVGAGYLALAPLIASSSTTTSAAVQQTPSKGSKTVTGSSQTLDEDSARVTSRDQTISIIRITGRVDHATASDLEAMLKNLVENNHINLVVNLQGVDFMSSRGLGVLVSTMKTLKRVNGDLRLCTPSARVEEVLRLAGLTRVLHIYTSEEEAVNSFLVGWAIHIYEW